MNNKQQFKFNSISERKSNTCGKLGAYLFNSFSSEVYVVWPQYTFHKTLTYLEVYFSGAGPEKRGAEKKNQ